VRRLEWELQLDFPLDWELKLRFSVLPERPTPSVIKNGRWMRVLRVRGRPIPVIVESRGTVESPRLVFSAPVRSRLERVEVEKLVKALHGLSGVEGLYRFMEGDSVLRRLKRELYGFGRAGLMAPTVYEGVVKAIIQQQIALRVAESITANLAERYGYSTEYAGEVVYDFPSPETLARLTVEELRGCGLSRAKSSYVKEFSAKVVKGFDPESLRGKEPGEVMEALTRFKGIGRWTAELVMVATLGLNVVPADDLGVRKAVSHFYFDDELQPPDVVRRFVVEKFGSYLRDVIVYLLMAYRMGL